LISQVVEMEVPGPGKFRPGQDEKGNAGIARASEKQRNQIRGCPATVKSGVFLSRLARYPAFIFCLAAFEEREQTVLQSVFCFPSTE
jgi:hypothetical protein